MQELTITMSKMLACAGASILGSASKRRRVSCRNGRLATTNPWSERTGGQTSTVGVQSSRVMTTSNQPPSLCVGTNTCCVSPNCSSICRKLVAEEEEGVASWMFTVQVTEDHYLCIVECNLFHCCRKFLEKCRRGVYRTWPIDNKHCVGSMC